MRHIRGTYGLLENLFVSLDSGFTVPIGGCASFIFWSSSGVRAKRNFSLASNSSWSTPNLIFVKSKPSVIFANSIPSSIISLNGSSSVGVFSIKAMPHVEKNYALRLSTLPHLKQKL